ncbi:MAG: NUDIX domain-containing protein [Candidatus Helarchaeales archaeon]
METKKIKKYPAVTVDGIIINGDHLLLVKRKHPPHENKWALPGGFVELGETVEQACVREVKEETNIDVEFDSFLGVYSKPDRDPRGHVITVACICKMKIKEQVPVGADDAREARFFSREELASMRDLLAFDHLQIIQDSGFF